MSDQPKIQAVQVQAQSPNAFRAGEWANVIGIVAYTPPGKAAVQVQF